MNKHTQNKAMAFIAYGANTPLWLALRNNPHPEHGGDRWFVVTGSVESGETLSEAAKREVLEETGLKTEKLVKLNKVRHSYISNNRPGIVFDEQGYLAVVDSRKVQLNIEHVDYAWLSLDNLINIIWWEGDKTELRKVLEEAYESVSTN